MRTAGKRSSPGASCSTRYVTRSEREQSSSTIRTVSAPKSTSACPGSGVSSGPSATTSSTGRSSAAKRSRILSSSSGRKIAIVADVLPHVERRRLGPSDLEITPVGVGTAPIGSRPGIWSVNWGTQDEGDAVRAIHVALDAGVNWVDTAPFYGWGRAEEIVGKAVKDRREEVYIFTKCGTIPDGKGGSTENLKPDTIEREVEASLGSLQTDYIDLLQFDDADPTTPVEDSWRALQELVRVGKVRYGGLSNHTVDLIERALKVGPVTSNQVQYNPLQRKIEKDILPFSQRNSIGVLGWV